MLRPITALWLAVWCLGVCGTAHAQSGSGRTYVGASLIGDVKRFSGDLHEAVLNGETYGGAAVFGTSLYPRWDLQLSVDVPHFTATSRPRDVTMQRNIITLQSVTENQTLSVATLVRLHGVHRGRLHLGYLGGLSIVRLRRDFHTEAPPDTPSSLVPKPASSVAYAAGPTLGIDARIDLVSHLSLVPALHATVFSASDSSGILLRPRMSVRWTF